MNLFIEKTKEKVAGTIPLSDNDSMWGSEALAALYKAHPYLGRFEVNMQVDGQDNGLGYMYGSFLIKNPSKIQPATVAGNRVTKPEAEDIETAKVPVIVEGGKLYTFDVFIDPSGKFHPLSEEKLEETLFDTNSYTAVPRQEAAPYTPAGEMQPATPNSGLEYGVGKGSVGKVASALARVCSTVPKAARSLFASQHAGLAEGNVKIALALSELVTPGDFKSVDISFAVLEKTGGGFELHSPDTQTGKRKTIEFANHEYDGLGDIKKEAIETGAALIAFSPRGFEEVDSPFEQGLVQDANESAIYALMEKAGGASKGVVLPKVKTLAGETTQLKLVLLPSGASLQEKVAGIKCAPVLLKKVANDQLCGEGVLLFEDGSVSEPVTIGHKLTKEGGVEYLYSDSWGHEGILKKANIRKTIGIGAYNYAIPHDVRFIPLTWGAGVVEDPQAIEKLSSVKDSTRIVEVYRDGNSYLLRGGSGVGAGTDSIKYAEALYTLGALGLSSEDAKEKLAQAEEDVPARFMPRKHQKTIVKQASDPYLEKLASEVQVNLLKEAAELNLDQQTVDNVLSLNFVTPDNVTSFVEIVPQYEECLSRLAELLIGSRIGLPDVKEAVILTTIRALSKVVKGLKGLELRLSATE